MPVPLPTATTRWRCTVCGNLTRFDVTRSTRVVEYVHLDMAGEPRTEETEVLAETVESVRCRWCNALDQVELVDRPGRRDEAGQGDQADQAAQDANGDRRTGARGGADTGSAVNTGADEAPDTAD